MKSLSLALVAAFALVVAPSVANAGGGGGAKNTATLTLRNNTTVTIAVALNPSAAGQLAANTAGTTIVALQNGAAADGTTLVVLGPQQQQAVSVRSNTNIVVGAVQLTNANGVTVGGTANIQTIPFQIGGGRTATVTVVQPGGAGTALQFQTTTP